MTNSNGFTLFVTGPAAAGASALAGEVGGSLLERGCAVEILDAEAIGANLAAGLGDSKEDAGALVARVGYVANLLARNGAIVVAAPASPHAEARARVREQADTTFILVHANGPAQDGEAYEPPTDAEVVCDTTTESFEQSVKKILLTLESLDLVPRDEGADYSDEEEQEVMRRLKDLGYV